MEELVVQAHKSTVKRPKLLEFQVKNGCSRGFRDLGCEGAPVGVPLIAVHHTAEPSHAIDTANSPAEVTTDWHGNVVAAVNPKGSPRIMLAGHCDQIGLMVKYIDDKGFLRVSPIGGWDTQMLIGQALQVWTESGPLSGVIARKAIHLLTADERKSVPEIKDLWIDIGAADGDEAKSLIKVGDPVTLELGYRPLRNNLKAGWQ